MSELGFEVLRKSRAFPLASGPNRDSFKESGTENPYNFALSDAINRIDRLGLDVWVVELKGGVGHQYVVGDNYDERGTYWSADFAPNQSGGRCLICKGIYDYQAITGLDFPSNTEKKFTVIKHIKSGPTATLKVKDFAKSMYGKKNGYQAFGGNCREYADFLATLAERFEREANTAK